MIPRYCLPEMAAIWTEEAKLERWILVEILATEAWAALGVVPPEAAAAIRLNSAASPEEVREREKITDHDVAAFVDVVQGHVGEPAGKWVHYGLTSTDVVDTAQCMALTQSCDVLIRAATALIAVLKRRAIEFAMTPVIGRTHGVHAEPTTFGAKLALWGLAVARDRDRLQVTRKAVAVGKLSGAVGTYSNIDPAIEAHVCAALGLTPVPGTQVVARDRHAQYLYTCASIGATIETMAVEIRHLQRTEVREVQEAFRAGQKGSSAMPHKRNPIKSEALSGLARILRSNVIAGLENVALWHERDISHSSVERIVLPDSSLLAHYSLVKAAELLDGLVVRVDRMRSNLDASFGLVFSQPVLLALVEAGMTRDDAYRIVQDNAMRAWDGEQSFRTLLEADDRVTVSAEVLDRAFDLDRSLQHVHRTVDALLVID